MSKKPPVVRLADSEPLQARFHDGDGNYWGVARLIDDTKHLRPFNCPLAALNMSGEIWRGCNLVGLASHVKQVNDADTSKPIILSWDGEIADGRHRVIRAVVEGKRTIKAVRMHWRPEPCETKS